MIDHQDEHTERIPGRSIDPARGNPGRLWRAALTCSLVAAPWVATGPAHAHDDSDTWPNGIVNSADYFAPAGTADDPFNGFKVYLSSPRHSNSGSKLECTNPGREENINGRRWNWWAANGHEHGELTPNNPANSLHGRGFKVQVSPNLRDGGYAANRTASQNWGSDVHIITHTNGTTDPPEPACTGVSGPLVTIWEHNSGAYDDYDLILALGSNLNPIIPDAWTKPQITNLWELERQAPRGDGYVELQFHDYQPTQTWLYNNTEMAQTKYYGVAIDDYLNYP